VVRSGSGLNRLGIVAFSGWFRDKTRVPQMLASVRDSEFKAVAQTQACVAPQPEIRSGGRSRSVTRVSHSDPKGVGRGRSHVPGNLTGRYEFFFSDTSHFKRRQMGETW